MPTRKNLNIKKVGSQSGKSQSKATPNKRARLSIAEMRRQERQANLLKMVALGLTGLVVAVIMGGVIWVMSSRSTPVDNVTPWSPTSTASVVTPPIVTATRHLSTPVITSTSTPTATATAALPAPVESSPEPAASCATDNDRYRMEIMGPALTPRVGSQVALSSDRLQVIWRIKNVGQCAWQNTRLFLVSTGTKPPPAPPIEPGGRVEIGATITVTLSVPASEVLRQDKLNWVWALVVQPTQGEDWLELKPWLELTLQQPWVSLQDSSSTPPPSPPPPPLVVKPVIRAIPELISPPEGMTFTGPEADITFRWTAEGLLAEDEYYVLIIEHQGGWEMRWTREAHYTTPHGPANNLGWLTEYGPELKWWVLIIRTDNPGQELSPAQIMNVDSHPRSIFWSNPRQTDEE